MARVALIIDSETGKLIDVAGNPRETGRYARFARRMLSSDENPTLDYGVNGGKVLTISRGGSAGSGTVINLVAETVRLSGSLKDRDGRTIEQIADSRLTGVLNRILGKTGEVKVTPGVDQHTGASTVTVSLDPSVMTRLEQSDAAIERFGQEIDSINGESEDYVKKSDIAACVDGLYVSDSDGIDAVKATLSSLLERLRALSAGHGQDSASSGSANS